MGHVLRVGVVGVGFGRQVHVPALRTDRRCEVTAICSAQEHRVRKAASDLEIPLTYTSWEELLDNPDIDALTMAVPPAVQVPLALAALERGKPVFCEKPLSISFEDAIALRDAALDSGLAHMINFEFPENETWQHALRLLAQGKIGAVRSIDVTWNVMTWANRNNLTVWKTTTAQGGGTLNNFGPHVFHYLEQFGGPIERLRARLKNAANDPHASDTSVQMDLKFVGGATGSVTVDAASDLDPEHRIDVVGDRGMLTLLEQGKGYLDGFELFLGKPEQDSQKQDIPESPPGGDRIIDGRVDATSKLIQRFIDWILTGTPARPNLNDGFRAQCLMHTARRSHDADCMLGVSTENT